MPIHVQGSDIPLTPEEIGRIWARTIKLCLHTDQQVVVAAVDAERMRTINRDYRQNDRPTNVLTFSYATGEQVMPTIQEGVDHDVILCLDVARGEAQERGVAYRDYVALLLAHGFLHACGQDHERSPQEAEKTQQLEEAILRESGFGPIHLS